VPGRYAAPEARAYGLSSENPLVLERRRGLEIELGLEFFRSSRTCSPRELDLEGYVWRGRTSPARHSPTSGELGEDVPLLDLAGVQVIHPRGGVEAEGP